MKISIVNKIFVSIILCILMNSSGKTQTLNKLPKNFSFKYKCGTDAIETDRFDSKTGIYTRTYMMSDSSVKIEISEAEMLRIFSAFNENKFLSFPNYFECDDKQSSYITPSGEITIEFTFNGIVKKVINSYFCSVKKDKTKEDCFEKISSLIFEIIHNKPEVQKMKESDWIFE